MLVDVFDGALELVLGFVGRVMRELRLVGADQVRGRIDDGAVELEYRRGLTPPVRAGNLSSSGSRPTHTRESLRAQAALSCSRNWLMRQATRLAGVLLQIHQQDGDGSRASRRECARPARGSPGCTSLKRWRTSVDSPGTRP